MHQLALHHEEDEGSHEADAAEMQIRETHVVNDAEDAAMSAFALNSTKRSSVFAA